MCFEMGSDYGRHLIMQSFWKDTLVLQLRW